MARRQLTLESYFGEMVLMPAGVGEKGNVEALRITVFGTNFPQRAVEPELFVGQAGAQRVAISADQRSIHGYFPILPPSGARIRVRYGESQEGVLAQPFQRKQVRPMPKVCQD